MKVAAGVQIFDNSQTSEKDPPMNKKHERNFTAK